MWNSPTDTAYLLPDGQGLPLCHTMSQQHHLQLPASRISLRDTPPGPPVPVPFPCKPIDQYIPRRQCCWCPRSVMAIILVEIDVWYAGGIRLAAFATGHRGRCVKGPRRPWGERNSVTFRQGFVPTSLSFRCSAIFFTSPFPRSPSSSFGWRSGGERRVIQSCESVCAERC